MQKLPPNMYNAISYKIRPELITEKLMKILHLMTGIAQYGYKHGLSTLDAIVKIEQYSQEHAHGGQVLLMALSRAFDAINRAQL